MNFIHAVRGREGKDVLGTEPVRWVEKVTPGVHASSLGVVKPVFGNILIGDVYQAACVKIWLGLNIGFGLVGLIGPLPFELGRDLVVINNFQRLGLSRAHGEQKAEDEAGFI